MWRVLKRLKQERWPLSEWTSAFFRNKGRAARHWAYLARIKHAEISMTDILANRDFLFSQLGFVGSKTADDSAFLATSSSLLSDDDLLSWSERHRRLTLVQIFQDNYMFSRPGLQALSGAGLPHVPESEDWGVVAV